MQLQTQIPTESITDRGAFYAAVANVSDGRLSVIGMNEDKHNDGMTAVKICGDAKRAEARACITSVCTCG